MTAESNLELKIRRYQPRIPRHRTRTRAPQPIGNPQTYEFLRNIGITPVQVAKIAIPETGKWGIAGRQVSAVQDTYHFLRGLGVAEDKIRTNYHLLNVTAATLRRGYDYLHRIRFSDEKIATCVHVLQRTSVLERNYQSHIGFLREDYQDRKSGREKLRKLPCLMATTPANLEANVQYNHGQGIDYTSCLILLVTKPQTKREKMAWMLRELTPYRSSDEATKRQLIGCVRRFADEHNDPLTMSISRLEKQKPALQKKMQLYI